MSVIIPRKQRADLQLMSDGKRINWRLIPYIRVSPIEGRDGFNFEFHWKYKASIKKETTQWTGTQLDPIKHFRPFNIVELKSNLFINLNTILCIEELAVHGPVEKTKVNIIFSDGVTLTEVFEATGWAWWKTTFL